MIKVILGDITKTKVDCIINPANGLGVMHKGVSKVLMREGGPEIQNSAKEVCFRHGLYQPGEAFLGQSGFLKNRGIKSICHAVLIYRHPEKTKLENITKSVESSINLIKEQGFESFSVPSLGVEPRNIDAQLASWQLMSTLQTCHWIENNKPVFAKDKFDIFIIDINREFIEECEKLNKATYYEK